MSLHALISDFIQRFGPRLAGTEAETLAQRHMMTLMQPLATTVREEPFKAALRAKFAALKPLVLLFWISIGLYWLSIPLALGVAAVTAVLYLLHFVLYRQVLDPLYKQIESRNIVGVLEPKGEAKRTFIFSGHMDSTREFIWWYRLGHIAAVLMVVGGVLMVFYPIFLGVAMAMRELDATAFSGFIDWVWLGFAILAPINVLYFNIHGRQVVPGAQDNLSGCVCAYGALEALSDEGESSLEHTRIMAVSFGAEETGLKGSKAFVQQNLAWLKANNVSVINLDGIMYRDAINIISKEPMTRVKYPPKLLNELQSAFEAEGLQPQQTPLPIGATDGSAFGLKGIDATSVVAFPMEKLHPTYHTRRDTPEHIEPEMLEKMRDVLVRLAREADERLN